MYERLIEEIHGAWKDIRNHPHRHTRGADGVSIQSFSTNATAGIKSIRNLLRNNQFHFTPLRPVTIKQNNKNREILVATVQDRIVTRAILRVIQPKLKKYNSGSDYSIRRKNGKENLNGIPLAAEHIQQKIKEGHLWIFETDIQKFFDKIPKNKILKLLRKEILDEKIFGLVKEIVKFQVGHSTYVSEKEYSTEEGIAQGSSISPILASIYLYGFDKYLQNQEGVTLIRYVDDLVVLCKTEARAQEIYKIVSHKLLKLGLSIHAINETTDSGKVKTQITDCKAGPFIFLGLSFNYLDIDISRDKKNKIIQDLKDVLYGETGTLLSKSHKIEKKLESLIKQYYRKHYNTKDSLVSLCHQADKLLEEYYVKQVKRIVGFNPIEKLKLNDQQVKNLYQFIGLKVSQKVLKF